MAVLAVAAVLAAATPVRGDSAPALVEREVVITRVTEALQPASLAVSPDNRRMAAVAMVDARFRVMVDGRETRPVEGTLRGGKITFSGPASFHFLAGREKNFVRIEVDIRDQP